MTHPAARLAPLLLLFIAADRPVAPPAPGERAAAAALWSDDARAALARPTTLEAYRIAEHPPKLGERGQKIGPYYATAAAAKGPAADAAPRLAALLLADASYRFDVRKNCEPIPGVGFRVRGDHGTFADVAVCLECRMVCTFPAGKWVDAAPAYPALLKLARELFPDDKDLAALKD